MIVSFVRLSILEVLRQPTYVVTTLIFPSLFFGFFGIPNARDPESSALLLGSFSCFAVLGVVVFQTTVGIAQEREQHWSSYLRTLPISYPVFIFSRLVTSFFLSILAVGGVILFAIWQTQITLTTLELVKFYSAVILLGFPFAALGVFLGNISNARAAVPVANLAYLPLSFAGGLWMPPNALPEAVQELSKLLPTRSYGEIIWALGSATQPEIRWIWQHCLYTVLFTVLAVISHHRSEEQRFG